MLVFILTRSIVGNYLLLYSMSNKFHPFHKFHSIPCGSESHKSRAGRRSLLLFEETILPTKTGISSKPNWIRGAALFTSDAADWALPTIRKSNKVFFSNNWVNDAIADQKQQHLKKALPTAAESCCSPFTICKFYTEYSSCEAKALWARTRSLLSPSRHSAQCLRLNHYLSFMRASFSGNLEGNHHPTTGESK